MFLFFFISQVLSTFITLDIGSYFTKSLVISNLIPQLSNLHSNDFFSLNHSFISLDLPSNISSYSQETFSKYESYTPSVGSSAFYQLHLNPKIGTGLFPLFLDKNDEEKERISQTFNINDTIPQLSHTDTLSLFLSFHISSILNTPKTKKLSSSTEKKKISFVIPRSFTPQQEQILENALKQTKYTYYQAINDDDAAITYYVKEKREEIISSKQKNVLFVDIGATSIKAYAATFKMQEHKRQCDVIKHSYIYSLKDGGAYATKRMSDYVMQSSNFDNIQDSTRWMLFERCENIKFLFENRKEDDGPVSLTQPKLQNQQNFMVNLDQEAIDAFFKPLLGEIKNVLIKAIGDIQIDEVQIIGKSLHIPYLHKTIREVVDENIPIKTDLSEDKTLVIGGHFYTMQTLGLKFMDKINFINKKPLFISSIQYNTSPKQEINEENITEDVPQINKILLCNKDDECLEKFELPSSTTNFTLKYERNEYIQTNNKTTFLYTINDTQQSLNHSDYPIFILFDNQSRNNFKGKRCKDELEKECYPVNIYYDRKSNDLQPASNTFLQILRSNSAKKIFDMVHGKFNHIIDKVSKDLMNNDTFAYYLTEKSRYEFRKYSEICSTWLWETADTITNDALIVTKYSEFSNKLKLIYSKIALNNTMSYLIPLLEKTINKLNRKLSESQNIDQFIPKALLNTLHEVIIQASEDIVNQYKKIEATSLYSLDNFNSNRNDVIRHIMQLNKLLLIVDKFPFIAPKGSTLSSPILSLFKSSNDQQQLPEKKFYDTTQPYKVKIYE